MKLQHHRAGLPSAITTRHREVVPPPTHVAWPTSLGQPWSKTAAPADVRGPLGAPLPLPHRRRPLPRLEIDLFLDVLCSVRVRDLARELKEREGSICEVCDSFE